MKAAELADVVAAYLNQWRGAGRSCSVARAQTTTNSEVVVVTVDGEKFNITVTKARSP